LGSRINILHSFGVRSLGERDETSATGDDPGVGATNPLIKARGAGPSSVAAIWRHGWACFLVSVRHRRQIIRKRSNKIRKLLIYGARAALPYIAERDMPLGR
jgi:hypothetical protein